MTKKHRKVLAELCDICNEIGGELDGTATHESKYKDRQRAHMDVYTVLYGVLTDMPENDEKEQDWERLEKSLQALRGLKNKVYPDRNGHYKN